MASYERCILLANTTAIHFEGFRQPGARGVPGNDKQGQTTNKIRHQPRIRSTHAAAQEGVVPEVEFRRALAVRSEIRRAGWFN
jgi:hypothetical protein